MSKEERRIQDKKVITVDYKPPLDWGFLLYHLERQHSVGVERIHDGAYSRTIEVDNSVGILTVENDPDTSQLVVTVKGAAQTHLDTIGARVRSLFGVDADMDSVHSALSSDPWIAPLVHAYPGVRVPGAWSPFQVLVRTIIGQQVSGAAATTIKERILRRFSQTITAVDSDSMDPDLNEPDRADSANDEPQSSEPYRLHPPPEVIASGNLEQIGMPGRRVLALQNVARLIAEESIPFPADDGSLPSGTTVEDVKKALLELPGIGPWTVEYFALRTLGDHDAWPGSDLILRRFFETSPLPLPKSIKSVTDGWRPYRAFVAMHLWNASRHGLF